MSKDTQELDTICGSVERVTYRNPENGYSVIRIRPDQRNLPGIARSGLITAVGTLPELGVGENLKLIGSWARHPRHGTQFQIDRYEQTLPATVEGIRNYLGSGLIKGIGPQLADRIVNHFGIQTLEIIEQHPERMREVPDIGRKRSEMIATAWEEQKQVKGIMLFLHSHNISTSLAMKIYKHYGQEAINVVKHNPYALAEEVYGIGFKTADRIAQELGLPDDHPSRIEAGIIYTLNESSNEGNVYTPVNELVDHAASILSISEESVKGSVSRLVEADRVCLDRLPENGSILENSEVDAGQQPGLIEVVYLTPHYYSEVGVANRLSQLSRCLTSRLSDMPPSFLLLDPALTEEQQQAIKTTLNQPVSILTGGPGTGKTTAIRSLITALDSGKKTYALASPTGRAAKRLSEATGRPAKTIHRLLGYSPSEGFNVKSDNPLDVDLVVIDEASMLDLVLANNLLKGIGSGTHILFVGDVDQLPSVGAGDFLRDLITSNEFPVTRLTTIFRQSAESDIISNAHRINQGLMPVFANKKSTERSQGDFFLFPVDSPEEAASWVLEVVCERIPATFGFDPITEIQVLAPMYRGAAGVDSLNEALHLTLNPPTPQKPETKLFSKMYRVGDKLMQTRNNYDKEVFNGDIGTLSDINKIDQTLTLNFEGRYVVYDWSEADQVVRAYAISIHKSQGSEFPAIVIPILTQHYMMLQRNLLYTAVTRAKKLCVLVGTRQAIGIAVKNNKVSERYSGLAWRLGKVV